MNKGTGASWNVVIRAVELSTTCVMPATPPMKTSVPMILVAIKATATGTPSAINTMIRPMSTAAGVVPFHRLEVVRPLVRSTIHGVDADQIAAEFDGDERKIGPTGQ